MRLEGMREGKADTSGHDWGHSRARIHQPTKHSSRAYRSFHDFATFPND